MSDNLEQERIVLDCVKEYLEEARSVSDEWQDRAEKVHDMINGRINWGHKKKDQTKIHMNKVGLAYERIKAQVKQGIVSFDKFLVVEQQEGLESKYLSDLEAKRWLERGLRDANLQTVLADSIGLGTAENQMAIKLSHKVEEVRGPGGASRKKFSLCLEPLRIRSFYRDPHGSCLYDIHELEIEKFKLLKLASDKPTPAKPYKKEIVKALQPSHRTDAQEESEDKGNWRQYPKISRRGNVVVHEIWCTILDDTGNIPEWTREDGSKFPLENVLITVANEDILIADPLPNPRYNGKTPFVVTQLLRTPGQPYGRSLLGPGVDMNRAEDELISALIDAGLKEAYNVNILKPHGLVDPRQATGGIKYGKTLLQNSEMAPGEKVLETVQTGRVPSGAFQVLGEIQRSGAENMMMNEMNLSGGLPSKQVRASELAQSQKIIQGLFESIAGDIEDTFVEDLALQAYQECLQHASLLDEEDLKFIFRGNLERIEQFKELRKSKKKVFEELAHSFRFKGKGLRGLAANARTSQALFQLANILFGNPVFFQAIERQISPVKYIKKLMQGHNIDLDELNLTPEEAEFVKTRQLIVEQAMVEQAAKGQQVGEPGAANPAKPNQNPEGVEAGSGQGIVS